MTDDYLWDKTGHDAEVEKLESTLAVFRYEPTDTPTVAGEARSPSLGPGWTKWFVLVPAFGALVILALMMGLLSQTEPTAVVFPGDSIAESPPSAALVPSVHRSTTEQSVKTVPIKAPRSRIETRKSRTHVGPRRAAEPMLTAEEKYAYDRLMLALAITSSKLRVVQDKVNGLEVEKLTPKDKR